MTKSFAIGCLIQWYESDIIENYFLSLKNAISNHKDYCKQLDCSQNVYIDICISTDTSLEKPIEDSTLRQCVDKIISKFRLLEFHADVRVTYAPNRIYTISDYRREFNDYYCEKAHLLIWGESDMLVPEEMFSVLHSFLLSGQIDSKFIATFATCKMWDDSWKSLEHPDFTERPHSDSANDWWGVNYVMSISEMNKINETSGNRIIIDHIKPLKFNGCGLVISSEIIKAGLNVPRAAFFVHEDTAFMNLLSRTFPNLKQYHFKNILLVHNRKDKNKRNNIKGESGDTIGQRRRSNKWYREANDLSSCNVDNLFELDIDFYKWSDIINES